LLTRVKTTKLTSAARFRCRDVPISLSQYPKRIDSRQSSCDIVTRALQLVESKVEFSELRTGVDSVEQAGDARPRREEETARKIRQKSAG
jgi:hypothetical protein